MGSLPSASSIEKSGESDEELVGRARSGDGEAFASIVRAYQRRIYGVAMRMTRRHQVADDITQETFLRAYRNLDRFDLGRPLLPWLTRIAVNLSINYLNGASRKEQPLFHEDGVTTLVDSLGHGEERLETNPHRRLESEELASDLERAIERLSADQRAVFLLKVVEGMRYEEIALALEISQGTVMSRLSRARSRLKVLLAGHVRANERASR